MSFAGHSLSNVNLLPLLGLLKKKKKTSEINYLKHIIAWLVFAVIQSVSTSKKSEADGISTKSGKSEDKKSKASEEKKKVPTPDKKEEFVVGMYSFFLFLYQLFD